MSQEIERKFLVQSKSFRNEATSAIDMRQAYLSVLPESTVRVRIAGTQAWITVKGATHGATRSEWEYAIPVADATQILEQCAVSPVLAKTRYRVGRWEIDEFHGLLEGLTVAEIELTSENEPITLPGWIDREVTGDARYYNSQLAFATSPPEIR